MTTLASSLSSSHPIPISSSSEPEISLTLGGRWAQQEKERETHTAYVAHLQNELEGLRRAYNADMQAFAESQQRVLEAQAEATSEKERANQWQRAYDQEVERRKEVEHQLSLIHQQFHGLNDSMADEKQRTAIYDQQVNVLLNEKVGMEEQINSLKSELNTVYTELHTAQDRITEFESTHSELQHRLDVMTEAKRTKDLQYIRTFKQNQSLQSQIQSLEQTYSKYRHLVEKDQQRATTSTSTATATRGKDGKQKRHSHHETSTIPSHRHSIQEPQHAHEHAHEHEHEHTHHQAWTEDDNENFPTPSHNITSTSQPHTEWIACKHTEHQHRPISPTHQHIHTHSHMTHLSHPSTSSTTSTSTSTLSVAKMRKQIEILNEKCKEMTQLITLLRADNTDLIIKFRGASEARLHAEQRCEKLKTRLAKVEPVVIVQEQKWVR